MLGQTILQRWAIATVSAWLGVATAASAEAAPPAASVASQKPAAAAGNARGGTARKAASPAPVDHKRGKAPPQPAARLPAGANPQPQDRVARRQIAAGATAEELRARATDPELAALKDAERVLFPRPLVGFRPGWSWGQPDPSAQASGLPPTVEALPSATVPEAVNSEWLRSLKLPDFPVKLDPLVVQYLRFYRDTSEGRAIAQVWARKVGRYSAAMREELAKANLPRDLVWLSLIESGHSPTIVSPAGAAGLWQFIPDTGRIYGLTVDRWVDERLDPMLSTHAAARFLSDLHLRFGSWELAMAAYNMGHAGLLKAMRKYNSNDYWKLSQYEAGLPWETTLYVPKIFAIAIVMNNRRAFGLHEIEADPAITFDTVYVNSALPLEEVARAAGIPVTSLRSMNPQYQGDRVPPAPATSEKSGKSAQRWPVRVPRGTGAKATRALTQSTYRLNYETYTLRFGDTLEAVAAQSGTDLEALATLNMLTVTDTPPAGAVLLIPRQSAERKASAALPAEPMVVPDPALQVPGRRRVFYRVLRSDTLPAVANALDVTPDELVVWNELDENAKLQAGLVLQAFVAPNTDLSRVRVVQASEAKLLQVGSSEFLTHFEGLNGRKRLFVKAREGDTLEKIGKRHGLSVGMMERINRCSRSRALKVGEEVIVYANAESLPAKPILVSSSPERVGRPVAQLQSPLQAPRPDLLPQANTP